nr:O-antigen ligase family protein [Methylomarinum sp. Ch1-1]MDP4521184.1 O-antigen ligase family protein [Methylomarinum sp. Ch1-1]
MIAETIGSLVGLALGLTHGKRLLELFQHILSGGKGAFLASAGLYVIGYLAVSFFPYDFVTSFQELGDKLASGQDSLFISSSCGGLIRCSAKLTSEIVLAVPLGIFFGALLKWHPQRLTAVMLIGFIFGTVIEASQVLLVSGVAQGISVLTRILGMGLGEKLYKNIGARRSRTFINPALRKYIVIACLPYVLLLAGLNGWSWSNTYSDDVTGKLSDIHWLPFYYHYYTSESVALTSLLSVLFMYMPVGLGLWLWKNSGGYTLAGSKKFSAGLYAAGLAFALETSKLFLNGKHPDPTNLLISFISAYLTYAMADLMYGWFHQQQPEQHKPHPDASNNNDESETEQPDQKPPSTDRQSSSVAGKTLAALIFAALAWKLIDYPGNSPALCIVLVLYSLLIYRFPQAWLIALPALLPISDLSPWTGRLFFTEFDYFVLTTIAISCWRNRLASPFKNYSSGALLLLLLYAIFYTVSMIKGLLPIQPLDANAFSTYYSHYNSLRIAKGLYWALLLLPMLSFSLSRQKNATRYFGYGLLGGLTIVSLFAIAERAAFTGLFDFSSDFRITSTFYSMHTGGAHLDAFLLIGLPFIYLLLNNKPSHALFGLILFSGGLYTLLMTFSRGAYLALGVEFIALFIGLLIGYKRLLSQQQPKWLWASAMVILAIAISTPVLQGRFIQHRFQQSDEEAQIRSSHWLNAINMMDSDWPTALWGMGLGTFPRSYFWNSIVQPMPATFSLKQDEPEPYLQLRGGAPLYLEQIIDVDAYTDYPLTFEYRAYASNSGLNIDICEKAVQHSFDCQSLSFNTGDSQNWRQFKQTINTREAGNKKDNLLAGTRVRPVKLILHNGQTDSVIDIKNIALLSPSKNNLLKNGDFTQDMDHWFFTADDHIPWRSENLWVQILFEQGWLGAILFTWLIMSAFLNLYKQLGHRQISPVILASLSGLVIIGIVDSCFDAPNIALISYLIIFLSLQIIDPKNEKRP